MPSKNMMISITELERMGSKMVDEIIHEPLIPPKQANITGHLCLCEDPYVITITMAPAQPWNLPQPICPICQEVMEKMVPKSQIKRMIGHWQEML